MPNIVVGVGGSQTIGASGSYDADFLGVGTLDIAGTPGAPIDVTLATLAGLGALDTINISDANTTLDGVAGVSLLMDINIGSGGSLDLASTAGLTVGSTITFTAQSGTLTTASGVDLSLLSGIAGFSAGNKIDVPQAATTASYVANPGANAGGTLSLLDTGGNTVAQLPLSTGDFTTGSFVLQPDGAGGTAVGIQTTVSGVTTNPPTGDLGTGQSVTLMVATSQPVTVAGGTPTLSLNDGGVATYDPGLSTPDTLAFVYTVSAGQDTPDLGITGANLNGATVTDGTGDPANLSGAVGALPGIAVDTDTGTGSGGTGTGSGGTGSGGTGSGGTGTGGAVLNPFATLSVSNNDSTTVVTVTAKVSTAIAGTYGDPGMGSFAADGVTYTVSGTAAQVNAALAGVTLTPAAGSPTQTGIVASVSDNNPSVQTTLIDSGGLANDLSVLSASDAVVAGTGSDTLRAGAAGDTLTGGVGSGVLIGNAAGSTLLGGTGSSTFFSEGGPTLIHAGGAQDTISAALGNVSVASATGGHALVALSSGPSLLFGEGADTIIGGSGPALISMANGSFAGLGSGNDTVFAGQGSTIVGGSGPDLIGVEGSGITLYASTGEVTFLGGSGSSTVVGATNGSSFLYGGSGGGLFAGGAAGNNVLIGGTQATTIFGAASGDALYSIGSAGTLLVAGAGNETLQGAYSSGNDVLFTGAGSDLVGLGSGQDVLFAGSGTSTVVAGTGADVFAFTNGKSGGTENIIGFKFGTDKLNLQGYASGEAAQDLARATVNPGTATTPSSTTITLSDNTRIVFQGVSGVGSNLFS